jgi:hypothetical protein
MILLEEYKFFCQYFETLKVVNDTIVFDRNNKNFMFIILERN